VIPITIAEQEMEIVAYRPNPMKFQNVVRYYTAQDTHVQENDGTMVVGDEGTLTGCQIRKVAKFSFF